MTSRDFCYWLQGYFEILRADPSRGPVSLSAPQIECIRNHLRMVFITETAPTVPSPPMPPPPKGQNFETFC